MQAGAVWQAEAQQPGRAGGVGAGQAPAEGGASSPRHPLALSTFWRLSPTHMQKLERSSQAGHLCPGRGKAISHCGPREAPEAQVPGTLAGWPVIKQLIPSCLELLPCHLPSAISSTGSER